MQSAVQAYDEKYRHPNFFGYRPWLYRPFIRALARRTRLAKGSRVLDLGCGQGFFTWLFADLGMEALGVDISAEGIRRASREYGSGGAKFEVGDVLNLPYKNAFDCVFVRSCSLYNSDDFETKREVTDVFLGYLKAGGVLIFDYCSKLSPRRQSTSWRYLSFASVKNHFSCYPESKVFFSLRLDAMLLNSLALSFPVTRFAVLVSWGTGIGGELVGIVRKR